MGEQTVLVVASEDETTRLDRALDREVTAGCRAVGALDDLFDRLC